MSLVRYDTSYDLRDRARLLKNVHLSPLREAALHTPKPVPHMHSIGERAAEWRLGSMAQVIMREVPGETALPEWGSEIPEKGARDVPEPIASAPAVTSARARTPPVVVSEREEKKKEKKVWKDLDKFYASESESEEEEEEESEEEEEEEKEVDEDDDDEEEEEEDGEEEESEEDESESGDETTQLRQNTKAWR
jgi:AP-3 complex subunit beta